MSLADLEPERCSSLVELARDDDLADHRLIPTGCRQAGQTLSEVVLEPDRRDQLDRGLPLH